MNARRHHRATALAALALIVTTLGGAAPAGAQSSASFKLTPGSTTSISGASQGSGKSIRGESGSGLVAMRSSSATRDVIGGFIGGAFSSQATVTLVTQPGEFALIGVPLATPDPSFGALFEELGGVDVTRWRLGHWSPLDNAYQSADAGNLGPIVRGQGLWWITPDARSVAATGLPAPALIFDILLGAGPADAAAWNQVANPFLYPIDVSRMIVSNGVNTFLLTNPSNTLTEKVAKVWDTATDSYVDATVINGRSGFWVKRLGPGAVHLFVPPIGSASGTTAPSAVKPSGAAWAVSLVARQGERACEPLTLGVADVPSGGYNVFSRSQAPHPPGRFLSLVVPRRDWGALSDRYVSDFRSPAEATEWEVVLSGGATPGEVAVEAAGFDVPAGTRLVLEDPRDGWSAEVIPGGDAVTLPATAAERHLRLRAIPDGTPVAFAARLDGLRHVYPSPFASHAGIALSLARGGDLAVDVFDAQGRRVRSIERRGASPGEHVLVWDGRDASGQPVSPGVYLARWAAGPARGAARLVKIE